MICKICRADVKHLNPHDLCQGCAPGLQSVAPVADFPTLTGRRRKVGKLPKKPATSLKIMRMERGMTDRGKPYTQVECGKMFDVHLRTWITWEQEGPSLLCIERLWRLRWI